MGHSRLTPHPRPPAPPPSPLRQAPAPSQKTKIHLALIWKRKKQKQWKWRGKKSFVLFFFSSILIVPFDILILLFFVIIVDSSMITDHWGRRRNSYMKYISNIHPSPLMLSTYFTICFASTPTVLHIWLVISRNESKKHAWPLLLLEALACLNIPLSVNQEVMLPESPDVLSDEPQKSPRRLELKSPC